MLTRSTRATFLVLGSLLAAAAPARADEGMWTFNTFPRDKVKQKFGFSATDQWLENARLAALKFGGGCSASFVSPAGLVATNHHCARGCIQELSSAKKDFIKNGFYAAVPGDEQKCPALELRQLVAIEDVTARIDAATKGLADQAFNQARKAEMSRIEKECTDAGPGGGKTVQCDVVTLWNGGRYNLYRYRKYDDVRLVFAPESSIAFFGGDPDNFTYPRYDLDVTFVRAYEGGKPAAVERYYRWSSTGPKDGELVFTVGHPGSTQRLQTVAQLEFARDVSLPTALKSIAELRGILTEFSRRGPEQKRTAATLLFGVENNFKRLGGQYETLLDKKIFAQKVAAENAVRAKIARDPKKKKLYGATWDNVAKAVDEYRKIVKPYTFLEGGRAFQSTLFSIARLLVRAADERPKPNENRLRELRDSAMASVQNRLFSQAPIYKELEELTLSFSLVKLREALGTDDPLVKKVLGKQSPDELAKALVTGSKLADVALRRKLWEGGKVAVDASDDPMIRLARFIDEDARALRKRHDDQVEAPEKKNQELIARALFELQGTSTYPDATGTLRISYGAVRGYEENGRRIPSFTTLAGTFERATGRDPYALPDGWLRAQGRMAGDLSFNFVSDTDIIGGNSGSPVINKDAEVVGLAFDGNIQSLGGAYHFDPDMNRTVSVSSAGILEALRSIYRADRIVGELVPARSALR